MDSPGPKFLKGIYAILCLVIFVGVYGLIHIYTIEDEDLYLNDLSKAYPPYSGYVLATHYSEVLERSFGNIFSLQCWASTLSVSVKVVEPFLHNGSYLGFELDPRKGNKKRTTENKVRLFDMFDSKQWRRYAGKKHLSGIVNWNFFLRNAPRQLILVDKICSASKNLCMICNSSDFHENPLFRTASYRFALAHNFTIVRRVCYNDRHHYRIGEFKTLIYGPYEPDESVVIFNHFGGVCLKYDKYKISIDLNRCTKFGQARIPTSQKILDQSSKYVEKLVSVGNKHNGYISVMFNAEELVKRKKFDGKSKMWQTTSMQRCIGKIVQRVRALKKKLHITAVFLTSDLEMHKNITSNIKSGVLHAGLKELRERLFIKSVNFTSGITRVSSTRIPKYIKLLETTIVANSTCLVLAGGGNFQGMASDMYRNKFRHGTKVCGIETIKEC